MIVLYPIQLVFKDLEASDPVVLVFVVVADCIQLQAVADSYIDTFCGRSFVGGTFTEIHPGGVKLIFRGAGSVSRSSGETRVIVGVKGPDPKRSEQRLKEIVDQATAERPAMKSPISPLIWVIVIVLVILAIYVVVRGGGL